MKATLKNEQGIALVVGIMITVVLLSITGAALLFSGLNLKTASNLKTGTVALQVADAGIHHGLVAIPSGTTFSYSTNPNSPTTVVSSTSFNGYTYSVTAINDSASSGGNSRAILTSTALGPNGIKKIIVAYAGRGGSGGLGAIYLPGPRSNTAIRFAEPSFRIDGTDRNVDNTPGPGSSLPGIAATDPAVTTNITNGIQQDGWGLAPNQMAYVTGSGGAPSVTTITPMSITVQQLADRFVAVPVGPQHVVLSGGTYSTDTWGQDPGCPYPLCPRITEITGNTTINGSGSNIVTGTGVLIVNGNLTITGNFTFHGLIMSNGIINIQSGDIYGSVLVRESTSPTSVGGNAHIYYSSRTISWVNTNWPGVLPGSARLVAWQEKF